jgi:hypothetical protein
MDDNVYAMPGSTHEDDFICPGCLAQGVISDALEDSGCPPEFVLETAEMVVDALLAAGIL